VVDRSCILDQIRGAVGYLIFYRTVFFSLSNEKAEYSAVLPTDSTETGRQHLRIIKNLNKLDWDLKAM